jgi:hypothetical protein
MRRLVIVLMALAVGGAASGQQLFVALETDVPAYVATMDGFPNLAWTPLWHFAASGAAATPDGRLYLCEGAFTTHLWTSMNLAAPQQLVTLDRDITALAYGRDALYGYSNYSTPKGIYRIDVNTGASTLVLDVYTGTGFLFFALDYNPLDDLFYGFTEYGNSGLYSINIDTGEMIKISSGPVAWYGMSRGLAVGNNTVFMTAVNGNEDTYFAYDLSQGPNGLWVSIPNPYPGMMVTGAAAWIPAVVQTEPSSWSSVKALFR